MIWPLRISAPMTMAAQGMAAARMTVAARAALRTAASAIVVPLATRRRAVTREKVLGKTGL